MRCFAVFTGTREWSEELQRKAWAVVAAELPAGTVVIVGDAKGLDSLVRRKWGSMHGICDVHMASWGIYRKDAGMARNAAMVGTAAALRQRGWWCVGCWAFPSEKSVGTHDCVRRLRGNGFQVKVVRV